MCAFTAVSIHNNFASGQTCVAVRTTDHKLSGRIHMILDVVIEQRQYLFGMNRSNDTGHQDVNHIVTDNGQHFFISLQLGFFCIIGRLDEVIVLRRNDNGIDTHRRTVVIVFNGNLALSIGTKIGHLLAFAAYLGQYQQNAMCQVERKRHVILSFVGRIAEHHTLVACTLFHRVLTFYSAVDVGALFMDSAQHTTRIAFKHVFALRITDFLDNFTSNQLEVYISLCFYFTGQHYLSGSYQRFASYFRTGVISQQFVKHSVRYLIGHFVGVSF